VIDLLVGMALAILCMIFGPALHKWWNRGGSAPNVEGGIPLFDQSGVS
jgi:hypothetical protein